MAEARVCVGGVKDVYNIFCGVGMGWDGGMVLQGYEGLGEEEANAENIFFF